MELWTTGYCWTNTFASGRTAVALVTPWRWRGGDSFPGVHRTDFQMKDSVHVLSPHVIIFVKHLFHRTFWSLSKVL